MTTEHPTLAERTDGRLRGLLQHVDASFFQGKTLLETGYFSPSACHKLAALGADVTVCDLSQSILDEIKVAHPEVSIELLDLNTQDISKKYDVIYDCDVLHHLGDPTRHLSDVCAKCDYLLIDTWVLDNNDTSVPFITKIETSAPFTTATGNHCSEFFIDQTLTAAGFDFIMPKDSSFNCSHNFYGWENAFDGNCRTGGWRFWIAWRTGLPSPLKV